MNAPRREHVLFVRRLLPVPKGEWGGMEKLMLEWFERVDTGRTTITLAVTEGWTGRFKEEAAKRSIELKVVPIPVQFPGSPRQRFWALYDLLKTIKPTCVVFIQA